MLDFDFIKNVQDTIGPYVPSWYLFLLNISLISIIIYMIIIKITKNHKFNKYLWWYLCFLGLLAFVAYFTNKKQLHLSVNSDRSPLKGATVELVSTSEKKNTNSTGMVKFTIRRSQTKETISVSKDGYRTETIPLEIDSNTVQFKDISLSKDNVEIRFYQPDDLVDVDKVKTIPVKASFLDCEQKLCEVPSEKVKLLFNNEVIGFKSNSKLASEINATVPLPYKLDKIKLYSHTVKVVVSESFLNDKTFSLLKHYTYGRKHVRNYDIFNSENSKLDELGLNLFTDNKNNWNMIWHPIFFDSTRPITIILEAARYAPNADIVVSLGNNYQILIGENSGKAIKVRVNKGLEDPPNWVVIHTEELEKEIPLGEILEVKLVFNPGSNSSSDQDSISIRYSFRVNHKIVSDTKNIPLPAVTATNARVFKIGIGTILYSETKTKAVRILSTILSNSKI